MSREQQVLRSRRSRPPLDPATFRALAVHYVGRYATTQARLKHYLERKLRERGWDDSVPRPDLQEMVSEFARLGYVDDDLFASSRVTSLLKRGYGANRLGIALRSAGISAEKAASAARIDIDLAFQAALVFARRKRLGPFGPPLDDAKARNRAMAAFVRAGHSYEIVLKILEIHSVDELFVEN
jgi:regulatory protein